MKKRPLCLAERIRANQPVPFPVGALLSAATPAYRLGMWARLRAKRVRVDARVISFGNLTAGGTGKTPAVIERARDEVAAGRTVAVLTRGYGTRQTNAPVVVNGRDGLAGLYERVGDEAALIAAKVPEVLVVKCADRVAGARAAIDQHGCDTLILDDGYQYVRLERDENVVLIDATNPFGNERLLPRGILREPIGAIDRATHVVLTRCDMADDLPGLLERLRTLCGSLPIRKTHHAPTALRPLSGGESKPLGVIRGERVKAVCGIANPDAFVRTLEGLGAIVDECVSFRDHAQIPETAFASDIRVLTTEKDAVRLQGEGTDRANVWALEIEMKDMD